MLPIRVGLVDKTGTIRASELSAVAAALNLQVNRDFGPIWQVPATVSALLDGQQPPPGVWPIFVVNNLPPTEGGIHLTKHRQPYALVEAGPSWSLAASHECLEMLVDPSGSRLYASSAIQVKHGEVHDAPGKFEYVVEVCDPSENQPFSYPIDGVVVSDFYTPHFFDPKVSAGVRYSFTGALTRPRQVLKGGYLSWLNPITEELQQLQYFTDTPVIKTLGKASADRSLRETIDSLTKPLTLSRFQPSDELAARREALQRAAAARAKLYDEDEAKRTTR
jgi:hypothetical protein